MAHPPAEDGPPLSIRERMALLQQAANSSPVSPQLRASSSPVVDLGTSSAQASLSSALAETDALTLSTSRSASSLTPAAAQPPSTPSKDRLSSYTPLTPTQSPLSSRASSPAPGGGDGAGAPSRSRAASTASASSRTAPVSPITRTQMLSGTGAALLQTGRARSGSASSSRSGNGTGLAPEVLTKLNIPAAPAKQRKDDDLDSLIAFSPLLPSSSSQGVEWTVAPPAESSSTNPQTAISSLASIPTAPSASTPPRLPPRRPTLSEPAAPSLKKSVSSSSLAPALPPRRVPPVPSATLPPSLPSTLPGAQSAATLPFRSRSQGYGVTSIPQSAAHSPSSSPALSSGPPTPPRRHGRPLAGSEFESVDLGRSQPASHLIPPAAAPAPPLRSNILVPAARPAWVRSNSAASSIASGSGFTPPHSPTQTRQPAGPPRARPVDPRARRRYDALFESALGRTPSLNGKGKAVDGPAEPTLDGLVVRRIWLRSRLEPMLLRAIWDKSGQANGGALGRDEFAQGMWVIDEELRRRRASNGR